MRTTIAIDWDTGDLTTEQIREADDRVDSVVKQFLVYNYSGQLHRVETILHSKAIDPGVSPEQPPVTEESSPEGDSILQALDSTYMMLEEAEHAILESSGDFEWASEEMVDAIQDTRTIQAAERLIRKLIDPRDHDGNFVSQIVP